MEDDNNTASKLIANDEIKEILRTLKAKSTRYEYCLKENISYNDESYEAHLLLDYIANLQQENQELNDSITWWNNRFNAVQRDYEDYKSRIEKADWYLLESLECLYHGANFTFDELIHNTSDILNGRSDE